MTELSGGIVSLTESTEQRSCLTTFNMQRSTCSAVRFYVAPQRVVPCLYVFVSSVFVLTASATSRPAQHTTTGWRTYKDSTTINYTCCKDLSVNAFFHVRATHLTRQVGSLPLAKNAKHSSSSHTQN